MSIDLLQGLAMFPHAVAAGLLIAVACSLLGVFVVLKRVVFIGITLSEVASLGIALAMAAQFPPILGAALLTLTVVCLLALNLEPARLPKDAVMGVIFVTASALAVLVVAGSGLGLREVKALLYGDLILTTPGDLALMAAVLLPVLAALGLFLRPILYTFVDRQAAKVLGIKVLRWELLFFCCLGLAVSAASKTAGALLVFCYLVAPASAGLLLSRRLGAAMAVAAGVACLGTLLGLGWSLKSDLPANQAVMASVALLFAAAAALRGVGRLALRPRGK